jgi:hypothetical protein
LKKPLIPENRKHSDDLLNLNQNKDPKKPANKISPQNPTDLVPAPTNPDKSQFKKPLIPENRRDIGKTNDDLLNAQKASKPAAPVAEAPKALKSSAA